MSTFLHHKVIQDSAKSLADQEHNDPDELVLEVALGTIDEHPDPKPTDCNRDRLLINSLKENGGVA